MKFENLEVYNAICKYTSKGYRSRDGKYVTFVTENCKIKNLGTYDTEEKAKETVLNYRLEKLLYSIAKLNLNIKNSKITNEKYIVFKTGDIFNLYGKKMIGHIDKCGYKEVILNNKKHRVHRVVAEAFLKKPYNKQCVNHIDGNKLNNNVSNLEWVTYSENTLHSFKNRLQIPLFGENVASHKLTCEDVKYIRKHFKYRDKLYGATALGRKFKVDKSTIMDVVNYITWKEVKND